MTVCLPLALGALKPRHHILPNDPSSSRNIQGGAHLPTTGPSDHHEGPICSSRASHHSQRSDISGTPSSPLSSAPPSPGQTSLDTHTIGNPSAPSNPVAKRKRSIAPATSFPQPSSTPKPSSATPTPTPAPTQTISKGKEKVCNPWDGFGRVPDDVPYGLARVGEAVRDAKRIVVITGAGISTPAIPDFRSATGLFKTLAAASAANGNRSSDVSTISSGKELFDVKCLTNPELIPLHHTLLNSLQHLSTNASPSTFHTYLKKSDAQGRLLRVYTQNIDGLEKKAGLDCRIPEEGSVAVRNRLERKRGMGVVAGGEGGEKSKIRVEKGKGLRVEPIARADKLLGFGDPLGRNLQDDTQWITRREEKAGLDFPAPLSSSLTSLPPSIMSSPPRYTDRDIAGMQILRLNELGGHGDLSEEERVSEYLVRFAAASQNDSDFMPASPVPELPNASQETVIPSMSLENPERMISEGTPQPGEHRRTADQGQLDDSPRSVDSIETTVSERWRAFESPEVPAETRLLSNVPPAASQMLDPVGPTLPRCIPLHGMLSHMQCTRCSYSMPLEQYLPLPMEMVPCPSCSIVREERIDGQKRPRSVGFLRASVVLYGEEHKHGESIGAIVESDLIGKSKEDGKVDLVIVAGTTLQIPGVKRMIKEFARAAKSNRPSKEEKMEAKRAAEDEADASDSEESEDENETRRKRRASRERKRVVEDSAAPTDEDDSEDFPIRTILLNRDPPSKGKTGEWSDVFDVWVQGDLQDFTQRYVINGLTPIRTRSKNPLRTYFHENVDMIRAQAKKRKISLGPTVSLTMGEGFANLMPTHLSQLMVQVSKSSERKISIRIIPKGIEHIRAIERAQEIGKVSEDEASELLESEVERVKTSKKGSSKVTKQSNLDGYLDNQPGKRGVKRKAEVGPEPSASSAKARGSAKVQPGSEKTILCGLLDFAPVAKVSAMVKHSWTGKTAPLTPRKGIKHAQSGIDAVPPTTPKRQIKRSAKAFSTPRRNVPSTPASSQSEPPEADASESETADEPSGGGSVSDASSELDGGFTLAVVGRGSRSTRVRMRTFGRTPILIKSDGQTEQVEDQGFFGFGLPGEASAEERDFDAIMLDHLTTSNPPIKKARKHKHLIDGNEDEDEDERAGWRHVLEMRDRIRARVEREGSICSSLTSIAEELPTLNDVPMERIAGSSVTELLEEMPVAVCTGTDGEVFTVPPVKRKPGRPRKVVNAKTAVAIERRAGMSRLRRTGARDDVRGDA